MADKQTKLDDVAIASILEAGVNASVGYSDTLLSKERTRVQLYYDGSRPEKNGGADSGYNSLDVFDGVEDMKAQLLETFSSTKRPVTFDAMYGEELASAKIRTEYVNWVLFNQNEGYQLFQDVIDSALLARNGVVKVWWEPKIEAQYIYLSAPSLPELSSYLQQHADEDPQVVEMDMHEDGVTIKRAQIKLKADCGRVCVELLAPEEFGIAPMAKNIETAELVYHRHEMTVSELIKAGYDKDQVELLQTDDRLWIAQDMEKIARFKDTDEMIGSAMNITQQKARRVVAVYECYLELDLEDDGESQLFKVVKAGDVILDKEPVSRKPFIAFCPLPRPSAFWGHNFGKLLIATQNARTYLMRSIINHAMVTNNPRMQVVKGSVMNPKELTENRFGGIVNVTRPNGIIPIEQAPLNPFVFQTIAALKADKEEKIGISDLSQGLNKDAISSQNSGAMIHELITVSQLRQKIVARNFAEIFLTKLYTELYRLVLENEKREKIAMIAGSWQSVDFSQWPEKTTCSVSFSLGYGEADNAAAKWANIGKILGSAPTLAQWFTPQQAYYVAHRGVEELVGPEVNKVLLPINQGQPPPPDPMHAADIAMKTADAKAKEASAQASLAAQQNATTKINHQFQIEMARIQLENRKLDNELQLHRDQLAHKVAVDAAEIELQKQTLAAGKLQGEAIPTR